MKRSSWLLTLAVLSASAATSWGADVAASAPAGAAGAPAGASQAAEVRVVSGPRVLVTPFVALNVPEGQQWIGAGVQDAIVAELGRGGGIVPVTSNTQVVVEDNATAVRLARAASVPYVIRGTVQAMGGQVRISAQVIDTRTGDTVQTGIVTGPITDLLALEDALTAQLRGGADAGRGQADAGPAQAVASVPMPQGTPTQPAVGGVSAGLPGPATSPTIAPTAPAAPIATAPAVTPPPYTPAQTYAPTSPAPVIVLNAPPASYYPTSYYPSTYYPSSYYPDYSYPGYYAYGSYPYYPYSYPFVFYTVTSGHIHDRDCDDGHGGHGGWHNGGGGGNGNGGGGRGGNHTNTPPVTRVVSNPTAPSGATALPIPTSAASMPIPTRSMLPNPSSSSLPIARSSSIPVSKVTMPTATASPRLPSMPSVPVKSAAPTAVRSSPAVASPSVSRMSSGPSLPSAPRSSGSGATGSARRGR